MMLITIHNGSVGNTLLQLYVINSILVAGEIEFYVILNLINKTSELLSTE